MSQIRGTLLAEEVAEYNKLDDTITAALLHAERSLPKPWDWGWTPALNKLVHKIRYLKLLLGNVRGKAMCENVLKSAAAKAKCNWTSTVEGEIL